MEILHTIAKPDKNKLKRFITTSAARELSAISEPCYYPKTKKFYFDLLNILNVSDKDVKEFVKRTYKGTRAEKWNLWRDPATNLLIFIMNYFLNERDQSAYSSTLVYYMIVQYARLMNKQIKYCDSDTFKYTLDTLTRTHLFFREKTISNAIYYLSTQVQKRFTEDIRKWDVDKIIDFIGISRHRISQSVKTFAENYYRNKKSGISIKTQGDEPEDVANSYQYQVLKRGQKIIDDVTKKITLYKVIDRKAFDEAKQLSKIKTSIATIVVNGLVNEKNFNNVKIALELFIKKTEAVSMICGNDFYNHVRKLMAIKRTSSQLYFKAQINILILDILKDSGFIKTYEKYTSQTQFIINSFLAFYLALMVRRTICNI